jgi:two-component system, response regulator PdtaR
MPKVLIVEDEMLIALDLKNRLERRGYQVLDLAASAAKAVELAVRDRPDIILVDVVLKGVRDGIDAACDIVEKHPVPVLFITGNVKFINHERLRKITAYKILGKPPYETVLMSSIEELLDK